MKSVFLVLILIFSLVTNASSLDELDKLASPIMDKIKSGETEQIVSLALSNTPTADYIAKSDLMQTDSTFHRNFGIMGKLYSIEMLHEQGITGSFWIRWYMLKFHRQPLLIKLEFYKPNNSWHIHSIEMDSDMDDYVTASGQVQIGKIGLPF